MTADPTTMSAPSAPQPLPGTCEVLHLDAARQAHASAPPRRARTAGPGAVVVDLRPRLKLARLVASYEMIRASAQAASSPEGESGAAGSWSRWLTPRQAADVTAVRAEAALEAARPSRGSGPRPAHLRLAAGGETS